MMTNHVDAVYENGVLRPLEPLPLEEHQRVRVTVSSISGDSLASLVDQSFLEQARKEVSAAGCIPTHEGIRRMTASDASSWSEAIIAERDERF
jgi:predicted DNA-binding antitoxin AbrB/MazE fold protein